MSTPEDWTTICQALGYATEFNMLHDLYIVQKMTLRELAQILQVKPPTARAHLKAAGVILRRRGGPNRLGVSKLRAIPDEAMKNPLRAAFDYNVAVSSIYNEKRRRREEKARGDTSRPNAKV